MVISLFFNTTKRSNIYRKNKKSIDKYHNYDI